MEEKGGNTKHVHSQGKAANRVGSKGEEEEDKAPQRRGCHVAIVDCLHREILNFWEFLD